MKVMGILGSWWLPNWSVFLVLAKIRKALKSQETQKLKHHLRASDVKCTYLALPCVYIVHMSVLACALITGLTKLWQCLHLSVVVFFCKTFPLHDSFTEALYSHDCSLSASNLASKYHHSLLLRCFRGLLQVHFCTGVSFVCLPQASTHFSSCWQVHGMV